MTEDEVAADALTFCPACGSKGCRRCLERGCGCENVWLPLVAAIAPWAAKFPEV